MDNRFEGPAPLSFADVRERTTSHAYVMYMNYQFLIKGGVYSLAAYSLFHILTNETVPFRLGLFTFWLASFSSTVVTIAKWSRGAVLANAKFNTGDIVLPIFAALPEYLLFSVVDPGFLKNLDWTVWYLVFGFHSSFAFILVLNRYFQIKPDDFAYEIRKDLLSRFKCWLVRDLVITGLLACAGALLFIWPPHVFIGSILPKVNGDCVESGVALCIVALDFLVIVEASHQYRKITKSAYAARKKAGGRQSGRPWRTV